MKKVLYTMITLLLMLALAMPGVLASTNPDTTSDGEPIPDIDELHINAYKMGADMIGLTAHIVRSGNVRSAPGAFNPLLYEAYRDDRLTILDYQVMSRDPLSVWIKVDFFGQEGWISAHMAKIVTRPADRYDAGGDPLIEAFQSRYVGQEMLITVKHGNARDQMGPDSVVIEHVKAGEIYRVLDVAFAEDGRLWLQVNVDGYKCWISSNLCMLLE